MRMKNVKKKIATTLDSRGQIMLTGVKKLWVIYFGFLVKTVYPCGAFDKPKKINNAGENLI